MLCALAIFIIASINQGRFAELFSINDPYPRDIEPQGDHRQKRQLKPKD